MMNGADLGPNVFIAMRTIATNEGWTALYRGKHGQKFCNAKAAHRMLEKVSAH